MGEVDLSDQLSSLYDHDRRSNKWWKKVFYKWLQISFINSFIFYWDLNHNCNWNSNTSAHAAFLDFMVPLVEDVTRTEKELTNNKRKNTVGRPSKRIKYLRNIGDHLPEKGVTQRHRRQCAEKKDKKRTKTFCFACYIPTVTIRPSY